MALKRKRSESEDSDAPGAPQLDRASKIRKSRLEAKIDQGVKQIQQALKLARGFERQKLGRRQKTAKTKKDAADSTRLEEEVKVLKVILCILHSRNLTP